MHQIVSAPPVVVVPLQARRVPGEITRLADAVAASGLNSQFCRWQPQDTSTWLAVAAVLDTRQAGTP
jgi:hypothetical protein